MHLSFRHHLALQMQVSSSRKGGVPSYSMTAVFWGSQSPVSPTNVPISKLTLSNLSIGYIPKFAQQLFIASLQCATPGIVLEARDRGVNQKKITLFWSFHQAKHMSVLCPFWDWHSEDNSAGGERGRREWQCALGGVAPTKKRYRGGHRNFKVFLCSIHSEWWRLGKWI